MGILYASERPPFPLFLGGAARCAHQLLYALSQDLQAECAAIGSADYRVTYWDFPDSADCSALGIKGVQAGDDGGGRLDCGYPIHLLPDFPSSLGTFLDGFQPAVIWAQKDEG